MKWGRRLRYSLREPLIHALLRGMSRLSFKTLYRLGSGIGILFYRYSREMRESSRRNVQACFPDLTAVEQERIVRESLLHAGRGITESAALWQWPAERVHALLRSVEGGEHLDAAFAQGRGVIVMTPHLGCWEMIPCYVAQHYGTFTVLYREHRIKSLDRIMIEGRERLGVNPAAADVRGVRALLQALKKGEAMGILPDQDPGYEAGQFAPFFGIEANTMTLASKLVQKSGAVVISGIVERLPDGEGYHLRFSPPVLGLDDPDMGKSLAAMNREAEKQIRLLPEQYVWSYQRFRRRPVGSNEPSFYR